VNNETRANRAETRQLVGQTPDRPAIAPRDRSRIWVHWLLALIALALVACAGEPVPFCEVDGQGPFAPTLAICPDGLTAVCEYDDEDPERRDDIAPLCVYSRDAVTCLDDGRPRCR